MNADVEMIMGENRTLEKKNEELENKYEEMKSALEGEKNRAQTLVEKMKINPKVNYEKEPIPSIEGEPTVWSEDYEADPLKFIKEWVIEADVPFDPPCPVKVIRPTPPITASEAPSMSASDVPSQVPTTTPPLSG
ncbi:hypothetical protein Dimus_036222 [Dionaea muscipula]